jgi:hypothetical protein
MEIFRVVFFEAAKAAIHRDKDHTAQSRIRTGSLRRRPRCFANSWDARRRWLDGTEIQGLQGLIGKTSPNTIGIAAIVPTFNGTPEALALAFQSSAAGAIGIDFNADSGFAAALRRELKTGVSRIEALTQARSPSCLP